MDMYYLLNVTVSGIKSLKEEVRLDFYKKTINKNFDPNKYRIKAIYGENGSGKSALITAIKIFQDLIIGNHYLSESKNQNFLSEIINKSSHTFRFSCEYLVQATDNYNIIYFYSVELGKGTDNLYEIKHEILKTKSGNYINNNYKTVFESRDGELISLDCDENNKDNIEKMTLNLLSKNSFIFLCILNFNKFEHKGESFLVHIILCLMLTVVIKVYLAEEDQHELYFLKKLLKETNNDNEKFFSNINQIIDESLAFASVNEKIISKSKYEKYVEKVAQLTSFIQLFKHDLISIDIDAKEDGDHYRCDLNLNYGDYLINKEFESTGIKKLIQLFDCFTAAANNRIVFIDEMDSNLNDVYLCKLIEYFMYYGNGQLCFTTHNLDPMTILKENKNSIDFLSSDNHLVSWTSRGNASPDHCYKNGMIEDSPFNIDATDFIGIFGE